MGRTLRRLSSCVAGGAAFSCLLVVSAGAAPLPGPTAQLPLQTGASPAQTDYVPHELVVRFKPGTAASERSALNAAQNARVEQDLLVPRAYLLRLSKGRDVRAAQRAYERNPNVQYAEPNFNARLLATPTEPAFPELWGMHNTGQTVNGTAGTADADIDAPEAWDTTTGSSAVTVGVADTGIAYNHLEYNTTNNIWANPGESGSGKETNNIDDDGNGRVDDFRGWDFVDNDNNPLDIDGHGTHVAGTIGAPTNNGGGVVGVNWTVRLAPLRVCGPNPLDQCSTARQADGFAYAGQKGMQVVNASLGGGPSAQIVADAIANAPNTLFVFAAGNENNNNDTSARYPCQYPAPNIICVAASDQNDNKASFSNYGPIGVDLAAPGTNILSTWTLAVRFRDTFQTANFSTNWTTSGTNNTWTRGCDVNGNCLMLDSPANYVNNTNSFSRTTNAISTSGYTSCRPQFVVYWDLANDGDQLIVESSTDGVTWGGPTNWTATFGGASGGYQFMDGNPGGLLDNKATVYLRFNLQSNAAGVSDGVYVDDVVMRCTPTAAPNSFAYASGTSQASPHVAGAAALAFAKEPLATVGGVKNAILDGVDKKASLSNFVATGGRLNLNNMLTRLACCHARPAGATPLNVSLVPAYNQCTSPNRFHGPPDLPGGTNPDGSCNPPVQRSSLLTVGTPDVPPGGGPAANSVGSFRMAAIVGDPGTPGDQADLTLSVNITDVRSKTAGLPDYSGQLLARVPLRITDRRSGVSGNEAATMQIPMLFQFVVPCATTASTSIGSTCSISTSVDGILGDPGSILEGGRAIWEIGKAEIQDAGADGDPFTQPNGIFAVQGVFVP